MQQGSKEVKSQGKVVGTAEFPIYDTVDEAVAELGENTLLSYVNAQVKTTRANQLRQAVSGKPSKASLMMEAMSIADPSVLQEMAGDTARIRDYIEGLVKELENKQQALAGEVTSPAEDDDLQ
jgi:hypothetical protein